MWICLLVWLHMQNGSFDFANARAAMVSPLAKKLFMVDGVTGEGVMLGWWVGGWWGLYVC